MPNRRKRTATTTKQVPMNIPYYYPYPEYQYVSPPYYTPAPVYPTSAPVYPAPAPVYPVPAPVYPTPAPVYPAPSYENQEYLYYTVNEYGQIVGEPTRFPPIGTQYYHQPYTYPNYMSNISTHGSHRHSPRRDRMSYEDYHHHHHSPPPPPHSYHHSTRSRHETLPPIHKHPFASTRPAPLDNGGYQQYAVRDLTERGSVSSGLSNRDAIQSVKHYDKLRKSYN